MSYSPNVNTLKKYNSRLRLLFIIWMSLISTSFLFAQKNDTVRVDRTSVKPSFLKEGTHRYLVYFKMNSQATRTMVQFWTREVKKSMYAGTSAYTITQEWEDKDSVFHTVKSVCDAQTFAPLYQHSWWKKNKKVTTSEFDFVTKKAMVDGIPIAQNDTAKATKKIWEGFSKALAQYTLNWHLDLEVFPLLDYRISRTFAIPYYDPGYGPPKQVYYKVTGEAVLTGYQDRPVDCWLLEHTAGKGRTEIYWISKKTREVLKLEQEVGNGMQRFKIKLAFSN